MWGEFLGVLGMDEFAATCLAPCSPSKRPLWG